jgi:hypothetical protein
MADVQVKSGVIEFLLGRPRSYTLLSSGATMHHQSLLNCVITPLFVIRDCSQDFFG